MERRKFIKSLMLVSGGILLSTQLSARSLSFLINEKIAVFRLKIATIISELKREGSNLVRKVMNGKKYISDPFNHYPYEGGIKDEKTGCQFFFHAHRKNEYGHFHTFTTDESGELVHLILISMNKQGEPIGLSTVNRWVTGDKYVKAELLKKFAGSFFVDPALYKDKRVVEFVNHIFKAFQEEINNLFDERDNRISEYVAKNYREPFEDRDIEVLSYKKMNLF